MKTISIFFLISLIYGTIYVTAQQVYRSSADDPQIQIAEDAANQIKNGADPKGIATSSVEVTRSLAPFTIVYDKDRNVIASNASLDGAVPTIPPGIVDNTKQSGSLRFTWQPRGGVRLATVTQRVEGTDTVVLSGRSLREVEERDDTLRLLVAAAWVFSLVVALPLLIPRSRHHPHGHG